MKIPSMHPFPPKHDPVQFFLQAREDCFSLGTFDRDFVDHSNRTRSNAAVLEITV